MRSAFTRLSRSLEKQATSRFLCPSREILVFSRVINPQAQFECQSGSLCLPRWYAPPSKYKARLRLLERGLTLPSSGRAFGTPLKSNVRRLPMRVRLSLTLAALLVPLSCAAFQPCPAGTRPCALVSHAFAYVVLPSLACTAAGVLVHKKVSRRWLRVTLSTSLFVLWVFSALVVVAAFGAFLAPCSSSCWY